MNTIDLRSDTVTKPTPAMREAMAKAEVGDDVYGEDPSVNRLQAMAADMTGKQAGLFVPSGGISFPFAPLLFVKNCNCSDLSRIKTLKVSLSIQ